MKSDYWKTRRTRKRAIVLAFITSTWISITAAGVSQELNTVYDNKFRAPLPNGEGHYVLPISAVTALAQPFELGDNNTVSSVTLLLDRLNNVSGIMGVSLWDESFGQPGQPGEAIVQLGQVDIGSLPNNGLNPEPSLEQIVMESLVTGLTPNDTYFVVLDFQDVVGMDAFPRQPLANMNSLIVPDPFGNAGTNGAGETLGREVGGPWEPGSAVPIGGPRYLQMAVTAMNQPSIPCDFSGNGACDVEDIDLLTTEILAGTNNLVFDVTGDNVVDIADLNRWLADAATHNGFVEAYLPGDADLDGTVNATDLNRLALNWQQDTSEWSGGDFTTDGVVDSADLNALGVNWRRSIALGATANAAVPEPSGWFLMFIGLALAWRQSRHG